MALQERTAVSNGSDQVNGDSSVSPEAGIDSSAAMAALPRREEPTVSLLKQREDLLQEIQPALEDELRLMLGLVQVLDQDSAARWMQGFLSAPPLNCPLKDRDVWIQTIIQAVQRNDLPVSKEILGLVASIISIESGFRRDPAICDASRGESIADMLERAEKELHQKLGPLLSVPPLPKYYKIYRDKYHPRLVSCRTEGNVDAVARSIVQDLKKDAASLPEFLRKRLYKELDKVAHVVRTKGSMQLNFARAREMMERRGEQFTDDELCDYVYTLQGGIDVGVAALKPMFVQYAARYGSPGNLSWLFFVGMDYHYGPFSSRNMIEQIRIRDLSGTKLDIDGDLLRYDEKARPEEGGSETLRAALAFVPPATAPTVMRDFLTEKYPHYIYTKTHKTIAKLHQHRFGETPFGVVGDLMLGKEAKIKHGSAMRTRSYLNKLDRCLNSLPWDTNP